MGAGHQPRHTADYDAVVVGAGFAGLYQLYRLREQGLSVRVFEAGGGVGGTWFWNRYPGARCDVESVDYQYSFSEELRSEWRWSERYPRQEELLRYLDHVADRFGLRPHIQLGTRVERAVFDEESGHWTVGTDRGDLVRARYCVMATGCLSVPWMPDLPGLEDFAGEWHHTGAWPAENVDFTGKRVAVVGTGSSGIQVTPVVAEQADELFVFQRTASFSVPAFNLPAGEEDAAETSAEFHRRREFARHSVFGLSVPVNKQSALAVSADERRREYEARWRMGGLPMYGAFADLLIDRAANDTAAEFLRGKIREKVQDPDVAERLLPRGYPLGGKRICVDTGYFEAFNRSNVHLVDIKDTPIDAITPRGPLVDGVEYPVDVIVFATGFDAMTGALSQIEIRGRHGAALSEKWAAGPASYLGLAVAGFPNLFLVTGPGSPAVFGNVVVSIEHAVDWISDAVAHLRRRNLALMEATADAEDAWVRHVNEVAGFTLLGDVDSWYTGANVPGKPRVILGYAGGAGEYRRRCDETARQGYTGFALSPEPPRRIPVGDGARLEISETGSGTPLVLVCGTGQDHRMWAPLLPALASRHRVITYNHRGIGGSERGERAVTTADLADDLADLLGGLGAAPAHLLGWSLGSAVAQELALRHPDLVASLVLCGTWGRTDAFQRSLFTALAHPWRTGHRDRALTALGIIYSRELLDSEAFGPLTAQLEPLLPSTEEQVATVAEQWDADLAHDSLDRLGGITAPALVVAGEQDLLTPAYQGRIVAETIPAVSFELFTGPGSSHALLMERSEEFADLVLKFLTDLPPT
ncbi:hypothetical protein GCM10023224_08330 [Streptomonospora halophila]|uniref:AB hydrolase-1 domain-containing protein n=1 Tax=Streptomonospora halophila TaxID=427369 RepID=A0ABP9G7I1_9ACTN